MPTRPDVFAYHALQAGRIVVDPDAGTITSPTGYRLERVDKRTAYGRVVVNRYPLVYAMAHRIVWIAAHGLLPDTIPVRHRNGIRWDNRLVNLEAHVQDHRDPPPADPDLDHLVTEPAAPLHLRPSWRRRPEWRWSRFI